MNNRNNSWFAKSQPQPTARLRLFCFPHAGGSAMVFRNWQNFFSPWVEVCAVQYPGRGTRMTEQPFTSMESLVAAIEEAISGFLDRPFAFFGHSMGATISCDH